MRRPGARESDVEKGRRPVTLRTKLHLSVYVTLALLILCWPLMKSAHREEPAPTRPPVSPSAAGPTVDDEVPPPESATLEAAASVVGRIVRSDTGERVLDAWVRVRWFDPARGYQSRLLEAKDGTFRADGLTVGQALTVTVAADGLMAVIENADPSPDPVVDRRYTTAAWVMPGENRVTVRMVEALPLGVRVVDPDGRPLEGIEVHVDDCCGWLEYEAVARTGAEGVARFGVPRGDNLHVRVEVGESERAYEMIEPAEGERVDVTLTVDGTDTGFAGRVLDEAGAPVAGVVVIAAKQGGGATTDREGRFTVLGMAPATEHVVAFRPGYLPASRTIRIEEGRVVSSDLTLSRGLSISGRVVDQGGDPAAGIGVRTSVVLPHLNYVMHRASAEPRTDGEGRFVLSGLPEGDYDLEGRIPYEGGTSRTVDLKKDVPAGTHGLEIVIRRRTFTIRGRVRIDGQPPGRPFAVTALDPDGDVERGPVVFVTADGRFTLSGLAAGDYRIVAHAKGFAASAPASVVLAKDTPAPEVELHLGTPEAVVTIRARDQRGRPVPDLEVALSCRERPGYSSGELDRSGELVLAGLPAGRARLELSAQREDGLRTAVDLDLVGGERVEVSISLRVRVSAESWDEEGPFREGDLVRAVNGVPVATSQDVATVIGRQEEDEPITFTVERAGETRKIVIGADQDIFDLPDFADEFEVAGVEVR
jgi:protocatechuate 3,4-dioxygenase beta subunit